MKRLLLAVFLVACSGRSAYQRYPGAPAAFDRGASDAKAVEIADKVFAAAGGVGNWDKAKQIRWRQTITADGKLIVDFDHIWDRWNGRHLGRLHRTDGTDLVIGYDLYGSFSMGYIQQPGEKEKKTNLDEGGRAAGLKIAKEAFNEHTAIMTMQFLMLEPGTKLAYVGPQNDEAGKDSWDELKVTFADPLRQDLEFHPIVDRATSTLVRVEVYKGTQKIAYTLKDWVTINGLKFAANRVNVGYAAETIAVKDIKVGNPEDSEFIAPITP